jgi:paraquat-inducible protein B
VVVVFKDSIAGLDVGAPVTFRGVRIGRVGGIRLHVDVSHQASWIPVYLDIDLARISWADGSEGGKRADLQAAVDSGLRAQLISQGLLSGQLSVNLDYRPDTRSVLSGYAKDAFEIPTISSDIQILKDEFSHLDLPAIGLKTEHVLVSMQHVLDKLDDRIVPLADGLQATLSTTAAAVHDLDTHAIRTIADIDRLANQSRDQITTNGKDLDLLLKTAERATSQAETLVLSLNDMSSPRGDLQASLRDLSASASSLRELTHDLERNPLGTLLRNEKP